ncbi:MAG: sulfotransferase [Deltaproteobacteria bacterium]|nr:MAG: sulfotransferase [Deltaproteobacteria bacterium]
MTNALTVGNLEYTWQARLVDSLARVGEILRLPIGKLDAESILASARRQTGLDDLGDPSFREPLDKIVEIARTAPMTSLGRVFIRQTMIRAACNRAWMNEYVKKHPEVLDIEVKRPVFVLGFPRTGTTVLQNLLCLDEGRRGLEFWELTHPVPMLDNKAKDERKRKRSAKSMLDIGYFVAPEMAEIHEVSVDSWEECWYLFSNTFQVLNYDLASGMTEYGDWLMTRDMTQAYREYKLALQILLHQRPAENLVLKCPEHLWFLDALLEVFPDACIIQTHRDPFDSIASYCSLISMGRRSLWGSIDPHKLGADITQRFKVGIDRALEARSRHDEARFFDVPFSELVEDQADMIQQICEHFGLEPTSRAQIEDWLTNGRKDKRGAHKYDAGLYGLDPDAIRARYADYIERFSVKCRAA